MSFKHGKDSAVYLGGVDVSGYFNAAELGVEVENPESTTFKNSWKTFIPGLDEAGLDFGGYFDPTWNDAWDNIGDAPGEVLTWCPSGYAALDMARLVKVLTTTYKESAPVGDIVAFDWGVKPDGAVGFGHIIASETVTADANGTSRDLTAQSTGGAIAHLHVLSVSASDSIVVTIEDSSTGSSGWATIGTFASKSAIGAERIAIAGTVKRYVRAVYDVTGAGVSIDVVVALARL